MFDTIRMTESHLKHESLSLYHRDIYLPPALNDILGRYLTTRHSKHALERLEKWNLPKLPFITLLKQRIIEVGLHPSTGAIESIVYREAFDANRDIIISVRPYFSEGYALIKTVWSNRPGDNHFSLRRYRYVQAPKRNTPELVPVKLPWLKQSSGEFNSLVFPDNLNLALK